MNNDHDTAESNGSLTAPTALDLNDVALNDIDLNSGDLNSVDASSTDVSSIDVDDADVSVADVLDYLLTSQRLVSYTPNRVVADAHLWWRRPCPVEGTPIVLCGDLASSDAEAQRQLAEWEMHGVTHILDVREEWSDEQRVARWAPHIGYLWLGVDDHGGRQDPEWFEAGWQRVRDAVQNPATKVMVHCHMGVNRGPSMAFALLLALGWEPVAAIEAIVAARPIAGVIYALDALEWWQQRTGLDETVAAEQRAALAAWLDIHQVDVAWVVSRIRRADY